MEALGSTPSEEHEVLVPYEDGTTESYPVQNGMIVVPVHRTRDLLVPAEPAVCASWIDLGFLVLVLHGGMALRVRDRKTGVWHDDWAGSLSFACPPVLMAYSTALLINCLPIARSCNPRNAMAIRRVLVGLVFLASIAMFKYNFKATCSLPNVASSF
jgi:hypothetical protein